MILTGQLIELYLYILLHLTQSSLHFNYGFKKYTVLREFYFISTY